MEQASIDYVRSVGSREGEFTITVADFGTETIRSYTIIQTYEPGLPEFMIFPEPTEMSIAAGFTEAINIKTDIQTLLTDIEVPIELSDSAYKLVNNSFNQNSVGNWIRENRSIYQMTMHYFALPIFALSSFLPADVKLVLEVSFFDGSSVKYKASGINSSGEIEFQYVDGSAIDASGNSIPHTSIEMINGGFTFSDSTSVNNFLALAAQYGIPIVNSSYTNGRTLDCVPNSSGGLSCTLR